MPTLNQRRLPYLTLTLTRSDSSSDDRSRQVTTVPVATVSRHLCDGVFDGRLRSELGRILSCPRRSFSLWTLCIVLCPMPTSRTTDETCSAAFSFVCHLSSIRFRARAWCICSTIFCSPRLRRIWAFCRSYCTILELECDIVFSHCAYPYRTSWIRHTTPSSRFPTLFFRRPALPALRAADVNMRLLLAHRCTFHARRGRWQFCIIAAQVRSVQVLVANARRRVLLCPLRFLRVRLI